MVSGFAAIAILLSAQPSPQPDPARLRAAIEKRYALAQTDPTEENLFALANELTAARQYSEAAKFFGFGIGRFPKSARMRMGAGVAAHGEGRFDAAVEHLCAAVDIDPTDTRALFFLGQMYDLSPALSVEVLRRLRRFTEIYPANPPARLYYAIGLAKLSQGSAAELREIEAQFTSAIRLSPRSAEAHFEFGSFLERTGKLVQAESQLAEAVRLDARFAKAWYRLGMVRQRLGKRREASEALDRFRALGGTSRVAR